MRTLALTVAFRSFRAPRSAFRVWSLLLAASCNPHSTRPIFLPFPETPVIYLDASPARVTQEITAGLTARGLRIARSVPRDGYVETDWYDPVTRRSFKTERDLPSLELERVYRIRCWSDPDVLGASKVTIEPTVRPRYDPSRIARDLEQLAPQGHAGRVLVDSLAEAVKRTLGVPAERR